MSTVPLVTRTELSSSRRFFYSFYYSFLNPKTWTFHGPWGTCATRSEYWCYLLGMGLFTLGMGLYMLTPLVLVVPVLLMIFAYINPLHHSVPSTRCTIITSAVIWLAFIINIGCSIIFSLSWSFWLGHEQIENLLIVLDNLSLFILGFCTMIGQCYIVCRRAHDFGMRGLWWNIIRIGGFFLFLLLGFILSWIIPSKGATIGVFTACLIVGVISDVAIHIMLGLIPSKPATKGNPLASSLGA